MLQNLNLLCDEAENGQIAIDFHKQGRTYDLVLMDKEMPVMDGHEATRQLRNMGVKTPIVALTGNALTTDREMFFEAGVDDFQTKVHISLKCSKWMATPLQVYQIVAIVRLCCPEESYSASFLCDTASIKRQTCTAVGTVWSGKFVFEVFIFIKNGVIANHPRFRGPGLLSFCFFAPCNICLGMIPSLRFLVE